METNETKDYQDLATALLSAVGERKNTEAQRKLELAPHDAIAKRWKPLLDAAKATEDALRDRVLEELERLEGLQRRLLERAATNPGLLSRILQIPEIHGVSFMFRDDVEIIDATQIPRAYWAPDEAKIKKAALAGVPISGVRVVQRRSVVVR